MADQIKFTTVTASIAAQTILVTNAAGASVNLNIQDVGTITAVVKPEDCPLLRPRPRDFLGNITPSRQTFGGDASRKDIKYTLAYELFYVPAGQANVFFEHYGDMVNALQAVLLWFMDNSQLITGCQDLLPGAFPSEGGLVDGNNTIFHGGVIELNIWQFLEA